MQVLKIIRKLHIYTGLVLVVPLLIFALSGFVLNHRWSLWETWNEREITEQSVKVDIPGSGTDTEKAREIIESLGYTGEMNLYIVNDRENSLLVRAHRPGQMLEVKVALDTGEGTFTRTDLGGWFVLRNLHTFAGLHSGLPEKKNWGWTKVWSLVIDLSAISLVFLTVSGIIMTASKNVDLKYRWVALSFGAFVILILVAVISKF